MTKYQDEFRGKIIDASREVFAKYGFRKTTIDDIARAIGKGKSTLYYYFKNKEEIFGSLIERESTSLENAIKKAVSKETSSRNRIRAYFSVRMKTLGNLANLYPSIKDEYFEQYGFIEKIREKYHKNEEALVKEILRKGVEEGDIEVKDLESTAFALVTALRGLEYPWTIGSSASGIGKKIDNLVDILFYGIGKE